MKKNVEDKKSQRTTTTTTETFVYSRGNSVNVRSPDEMTVHRQAVHIEVSTKAYRFRGKERENQKEREREREKDFSCPGPVTTVETSQRDNGIINSFAVRESGPDLF